MDVTPLGVGGKDAEETMDACAITANKNMIPYDERKPMDPSGIRLGTPALTTRGMGIDEMKQVGNWILEALRGTSTNEAIRKEVLSLCQQYPVPASAIEV